MEAFFRDVRLSLRSLLRSPGFTTAVVLTLALGIGANAAIFSAVQGVLLRPLPYPDANRLVVVWTTSPQSDRDVGSYPLFQDLREQSRTLSTVAAFARTSDSFTDGLEPEEVSGTLATADFFRVLGAEPALGRAFGPAEVEAGRRDVIVLSHRLWARRFGADPAIVGRQIRVGSETAEVMGVMPPGVTYPEGAEYWQPLVRTEGLASLFADRGAFWLGMVGRLTPEASLSEGHAELNTVIRALVEQYPETALLTGIHVEPLRRTIVGDVRPALLVLLGAVGFVLLIACANVANLLLARGAARRKEMAVRGALGATGGQLARQVLTESLVLAVLGGSTGVLVALWGTSALVAASPPDLPHLEHIGVDRVVLGFTAVLTLLTGIFFGLAPALQARTAALGTMLREGGRAGTGDGVGRVRPLLITLEVALALVLLVGAGLLVRSFAALQAVDPGFRTENVLSFRLTLGSSAYPAAAQVRAFRSELVERLEATPDVQAVRGINTLFLPDLPNSALIELDGRPVDPAEPQTEVTIDLVDPGFFEAMGVPIVRGRDIGVEDVPGEAVPVVAIVNESFVRRFLPGEDPIGRRFRWLGFSDLQFTIIGVAADMHRSGLAHPVRPQAFRSTTQFPPRSVEHLVTTRRDPLAIAPELRAIVQEMDPTLPIVELRSLDQALANAFATRRFVMMLLGGFAALAVVLATIGIYGVLSYLVGQRTREIGIRMALGAERRNVLALVLSDSMKSVVPGVFLGLGGALALTRVLSGQLYGITPTDPLTFATVTLLLLGVALLASWVPARRAARVEPMITLKAE